MGGRHALGRSRPKVTAGSATIAAGGKLRVTSDPGALLRTGSAPPATHYLLYLNDQTYLGEAGAERVVTAYVKATSASGASPSPGGRGPVQYVD